MESQESLESLTVLLSANAHTRVLKAIIETLGTDAVGELSNAIRQLDCRVGGTLRALDEIAEQRLAEPRETETARKRLEQIVRGFIRRAARMVKEAQANQTLQRTILGMAALDVLRVHGAVDVLGEWQSLERRRTSKERQTVQTNRAQDPIRKAVLQEAAAYDGTGLSQRKQSRTVSRNVNGKKQIVMGPEAVRSRLRRRK